jgi:hypothetical protein
MGGTVPQFGGGVRIRGSGVAPRESPPYKVKLVYWNRHAISLRLRANRKTNFGLGDRPPIWWEGVELGGRVWCPVKAHHTGHNLLIETDTLSLFVQEVSNVR